MARVQLREITPDNRVEVEALVVTPDQTRYVAGVADSLVEAVEHPDAKPWHRAAYAGDVAVGFVMISDGITGHHHPEYVGPYYLWRLLVDHRHQGNGYGTAILDLVVEYVRTRPGAHELLTSYVPGPRAPLPFYLAYGFRETDRVEDGEPVLSLDLGAR